MTKLIIDKEWLDGTIKYPLKINNPYYTEGVQDTLRVLLEHAKPLYKHHQYLQWAIEKKEGWYKHCGKWIKVTLVKYNHASGWPFQFKEISNSWFEHFQIEPPTPQNLTIEQAKEAIENGIRLKFNDKVDFAAGLKKLKDVVESKINGELRYIDEDGIFWDNCSYTKPLEDTP